MAGQGAKVRRQEDNTDGPCGPDDGECAEGYCCSEEGWCGLGYEYCWSPQCQFEYGSGCDTWDVPSGETTENVERAKIGSVFYGGAGIYSCTNPGVIALTYDDGPDQYTEHVLDVLAEYDAKATFFVCGNNNGKGEIDDDEYPWGDVLRRMYDEGHQIASHTWSHEDLSAVTAEMRHDQMIYNEIALVNVLGVFPTYMRPPYSSCTAESGCESDMADLGYHVVYFDLDTDDYDNTTPETIQNAKDNFDNSVLDSSAAEDDWLVISHDIHEQTAYNLTAYMLETLLAQGFQPVTVGECLGDPAENWYRDPDAPAPAEPSNAPQQPDNVSQDASCGEDAGWTCESSMWGDCCSQHGWCGSTFDYCGTGCQPDFGTCL
ncbi:hypothetical protein BDY21DRAFT_383901 [Lineolata rhizophorae]|uniref:Glycoside hydrolase/deacetylase n=1 Tax=Lineolata rhizophorae TaxID=578093 RepID=A0A6A6PB64_9PEZI|nr:hypothetical protein BDY21DRAFT_383901 [Lineolata rhizophorae]